MIYGGDRMKKLLIWVYKIPTKVSGLFFWLFLAMTLIVYGKGELLKKIEVKDISALYNTINNIIPGISHIAALKMIFPALTVISALLYLYCKYYKEPAVFIKHSSFSPDIAEVNSKILDHYYIKNISINQSDVMSTPDTYAKAIELQDSIAEKICNLRKGNKLCYYGIAHTPLIFRLGYKIGDENNIMLLHKKRNNAAVFEEWNRNEDNSYLINYNENNGAIKSNELLVSIATSLQIKENELSSIGYQDKHYLKFESQVIDFDNILSYSQAERIRNEIMRRIRDACKKYGIKRIHLAIASSSAFTFFLAQAFSPQHDPEIVVYHYSRGDYPWGIIINEEPQNAVIFTSSRS